MTSFFQESDYAYHKWSGVYMTSHLLIAAFESREKWRRRMSTPREDAPALAFGRLAHTLALEGQEMFEKLYVVGGPINPRTGKSFGQESQKFQRWAADQRKIAVTQDSFDLAARMARSIKRHPAASKLLGSGQAEQVARERYCELPCQIRLDWLTPGRWIVDYKTTGDIFSFQASITQYGYLIQAAFYQAIAELVTGQRLPYYIVACEKSDEATCIVWELKPEALSEQRAANEQKLAEIRSEFLAINERRPDVSVIEQSCAEFSYLTGVEA